MKKRLTSILVLFSLVFGIIPSVMVAVSAEESQEVAEIVIEAENYDTMVGTSPNMVKNAQVSGEYMVQWYATPQDAAEFSLIYTFMVEKPGNYYMSGVTTRANKAWTSDFLIEVNGDKNNVYDTVNAKEISVVDISSLKDTLFTNSYTTFRLHEGENTLKITLKKDDPGNNASGKLVTFFDKFTFVYGAGDVECNISSVTPTKNIAIYENIENISFVVNLSTNAPEDITYVLEVKDIWGKKVNDVCGVVTIGKGMKKMTLNLGKLPVGWYMLKFYEVDGITDTGIYSAFSVVEPVAKRIEAGDHPFASDAAAFWYTTPEKFSNLMKALKLSGIDYVRERIHFVPYEKGSKEFEAAYDYANGNQYDFKANMMAQNDINIIQNVASYANEYKTMDYDLFLAYNSYKNLMDRYGDKFPAVEVMNEVDWIGKAPADMYAAVYKASAIGAADGAYNPLKSTAGWANQPNSDVYMDILGQNDAYDYADIYNFHLHQRVWTHGVSNFDTGSTKSHIATAAAYNNENTPKRAWITEAGLSVQRDSATGVPSLEASKAAARYAITSAVQSVAAGTDKHFWFLMIHLVESNGEWGALYEGTTAPYPAYSALATLTTKLGAGIYKGELVNIPEYAEGYMFNNGKNDVAVIWAGSPTDYTYQPYYQFTGNGAVTVTDFVGGNKRVYSCKDGAVNIPISQYPQFIEFEVEADQENYVPQTYKAADAGPISFTDNQKLVIQELWKGQDFNAARAQGYILDEGVTQEVEVKIYNFNDKPMSGTLNVYPEDMLSVDKDALEFNVDAMESQSFILNVSLTENSYAGQIGYLKIDGKTAEDKDISDYVARVCRRDIGRTVENVIEFDGIYDTSNWDLENKGDNCNIVLSNDTEDSINFDVSFGAKGWFYPQFEIKNSNALKGSAGFAYTMKAKEAYDLDRHNVFVYMKDGREYTSTALVTEMKEYPAEETQFVVQWNKLKMYKSPLGGMDVTPFRPEDIYMISIGGNANNPNKHNIPTYTLSNVGYYFSDHPADQLTTGERVKISGVAEGEIYFPGQLNEITFTLPEKDYESYKTYINLEEYTNCTLKGNVLTVNVKNLPEGKYTVMASAKDGFNYAERGMITFYIQKP